MTEPQTDTLGNTIEGEPLVGPRGVNTKKDSYSVDERLIQLLRAAMAGKTLPKRRGPVMACTDDVDSVGVAQDNFVPLGPRGPNVPKDSRRA